MSLIKPIGSPPVRYPCFYERQGVAPTIYDTLNPLVVYSMRKTLLSQNKCIRIRRDSDDAEIDVGFSGGWVDEQAIKDFGGYNLLGYTEDLAGGNWSVAKGGTGSNAIITSGVLAPDGTNTAFNVKLDLNGGTTLSDYSETRQVGTNQTIVGKSYTTSVYLRCADGVDKDIVIINHTGHAHIRTIGQVWQRYSVTNNETGANTGIIRLRLRGTQSDDNINLEVWHPQAEIGSSATEYQPRLAGGASDCFVTTCYGVEGQNATQTTEANQPKIYDVATGEVTKENGKPAMVFDGTGDHLFIPNVTGRSNIDAYFVNRHDDTSTTATNNEVYLYPTGDGATNFGFVGSKNSPTTSLHSSSYGSPSLYKNNTLLSPTNRGEVYSLIGQTQNIINHKGASTSNWNEYKYGFYGSGGGIFHFEGTLQELAIFDGTLNNEQRVELHTDINNKFNIY